MKFYTFRNKDWSATINLAYGCNLTSLRHKGFPIVREPGDSDTLANAPVVHGFSLLIPPNRTCGGKFSFDGKEYQLPVNEVAHNNNLHGFFHSVPFKVEKFTAHSLVSTLEHDGSQYPFPFRLTITDNLDNEGFRRTIRVENTGKTRMPFVMAFHANFTQPESFSVPIGQCWEVNEHHIPTGKLLELSPEQAGYRDGCQLDTQVVTGFFTAAGDTARIGNYRFKTAGFDQWILYNADGTKNFLSVEPQLGPVNALNSGDYPILEPGQAYQLSFEITPL